MGFIIDARYVFSFKALILLFLKIYIRHGSMIKRVPKAQASRVSRGHTPPRKFLDFNFLKSLFPGFPSHSDGIIYK